MSSTERLDVLEAENDALRERLLSAERYTAQTLARATRLSQVIAVLGHQADFDTIVERAAVEVGELLAADVVLLMVGGDDSLVIEGQYGVRARDLPTAPIGLQSAPSLTVSRPVVTGTVDEVGVPGCLESYRLRSVAWTRLLVGDESLGVMILGRLDSEGFSDSDERELRAISYRIALAMQNGLLQRRLMQQLAQQRRIQTATEQLTSTLELQPACQIVADLIVEETGAAGGTVVIKLEDEVVASADGGTPSADGPVERLRLCAAEGGFGYVDLITPPAAGTDEHELLMYLVDISALALHKALLYERQLQLARRDALTSLLGHRAFHEHLGVLLGGSEPFSLVLFDVDDFKQVNDVHGHQAGDEALRRVAAALCAGMDEADHVFRTGGEEFCVLLLNLEGGAAVDAADRLRRAVAAVQSRLPITVSGGLASFPSHSDSHDGLLGLADTALYVSKHSGKNRITIAGRGRAEPAANGDRRDYLAPLQKRDPGATEHSVRVATLAVELGRRLELSDARLEILRIAARLHDIGELGIPAETLHKAGPLTPKEWSVVHAHPVVGAALLETWGEGQAARFVAEHHENLDGSGYPAGLTGDGIALESRIIRVADSYVTMQVDRPGRPALTPEQAIAELEHHSGGRFDPTVVGALL